MKCTIILSLLVLAACATQDRRCDGPLRPIGTQGAHAQGNPPSALPR